MRTVHIGRVDSAFRVQFTVEATRKEHQMLLERPRKSPEFKRVEGLGAAGHE